MYGKFVFFAIAALLAELCAQTKFLPFFLLILIYLYVLYKYKKYNHNQLIIISLTVFVDYGSSY